MTKQRAQDANGDEGIDTDAEEDSEPSTMIGSRVVRFDGESWIRGKVSDFVEQGVAYE